MIRISYASVFVDDQDRARAFYTDVLGFVVAHDVPIGEHRWLTVVGPGEPDGTQLLLEPDAHPASATFAAAIKESGLPATAFQVDDVRAEHARLTALGVTVLGEPKEAGPTVQFLVDDTCGNLIQLFELVQPV
jgi:catechol 2,3-dioxygenase-like lactoylglutathione lyase family enzyme